MLVSQVELTMHTAHGSTTASEDANEMQEMAENMPVEVTSYTIDGATERPRRSPFESEELWLNLDQLHARADMRVR